MNILIFLLLLSWAHAKTCSNHDGCSGDSISDTSLTCNGGERCCKDTRFTCTANSCTVIIKVEVMTSFEVVSYMPWTLLLSFLNVKLLVQSVRMLKYSALWLVIVYAMAVHPTLRCIARLEFYVLWW